MVVSQYDVVLVTLDPTVGHEIRKTRPCLVISPDEMNHNISTVIVAPMTSKSRAYPTRVEVTFKRKTGWIVLDQIRTIDKRRVLKRLGAITGPAVVNVKAVLSEMLIE